MTRLLWHQWLSLGLATVLAVKAASSNGTTGLFAFAAVLAIGWGFVASNAADEARVERDRVVTLARRDREAGVRR